MIVDINKYFYALVILERPFLAMGKELIDMESGELSLRSNNEKVVFNVLEWMQNIEEKDEFYKVEENKKDGELIGGRIIDTRVSLGPENLRILQSS